MLADKLRAASSAQALPEFVSSSINRSTTAGNTVTAPTGIQDGDLLVAVGFNVDESLTITLPSGFNVAHLDVASNNTEFIAIKTASSESGNYTFNWFGGASNTIAILVYRNATKVNTVGAVARGSGSSPPAQSITPTYVGTLVGVFGNETARTISTAPSGMTQRAVQTAAAPALAVYDLSDQGPSATSQYTLTWSGTGVVYGIQFQVTNEPDVAPEFVAMAQTQNTTTGTSLVINKPTGTLEGDLMVAVMASNGALTGGWTDTTFTEVADQGATSPSLRVAYKVAGSSEPSDYTFSSGDTDTKSGTILTYRYASYDTIAGSFTTGANPLVLTSISPSESQSILIAAGARAAGSITLGTPTSMTARATDNDSTAPSYIVCDQTVAKGPTATRSMSTGSSLSVAGIMLSIKPTRSL
jgi:hypothetical protein